MARKKNLLHVRKRVALARSAKGLKKPRLGKLERTIVDAPATLDADDSSALVLPRKAKTHKGRRILEARAGVVVEPEKNSLFMKGGKASQDVQNLLVELHKVRQPFSKYLSSRKQTDFHPFEDAQSAEYLCEKNDCSLFCYGSTAKKRPFRLVMGRTFERRVLDMFELEVQDYISMSKFPGVVPHIMGSKPLVLTQGAAFEAMDAMRSLKNLLCDFFSGAKPNKLCLKGIDHVIVLTALEPEEYSKLTGRRPLTTPGGQQYPMVLFRHYRIGFKRSDSKLPRVVLQEMGPHFDFSLDRYREPEKQMWKLATYVPKELKPKKVKNVSTSVFGEKVGRIHIGQQSFEAIHTPHFHKQPSSS